MTDAEQLELEASWYDHLKSHSPDLEEEKVRAMAMDYAARGEPLPRLDVRRDVVEPIRESMSVVNEVAAYDLYRWARKAGPQVLQQILHNVLGTKFAMVTSALGAVIAWLTFACATGSEMFAHSTCVTILGAVSAFTLVFGIGPQTIGQAGPPAKT